MKDGLIRNKDNIGHEITTLVEFPNENEKYKILKVIIPTNKVMKNDPLRLHVYTINDNGEQINFIISDICNKK